ncbi:MAG: hypothetical protein CML13_04370 [Puniceicoccaceae bacterium]|nr:hypothetical protein [Puniceicoccaceae bacterium]|tara:strand:+ start:2109 stop:5606 length:3498 start_codon:yes stop_codon:yes gene_type:complete
MKIKELFAKPIDRPIEGVIKADDEAHLANELQEYIITREVEKHLTPFLDAYNQSSSNTGAWISGFFGSGKSHLLKMLSIVLEDRQIDGLSSGQVFADKIDDALLRAELLKASKIPSKSILFNIDQKSDVISKQEFDAILSVFLKVFNEMQGFYPKQPYIAEFERVLTKKGKYEAFKAAFEESAGEPWESGRETAHSLDAEPFADAYSKVIGGSKEEGLRVLDRYFDSHKVSIEDFAKMVKEYIDAQEPGFRLNFFVDEVGQYIADNSKLMVNLQTIAESLATKCKGQAWILVTSQADMSTVVGEMAKMHTSSDFSKIQDRFKLRLPLTSQNVSEVIQKRLLAKKPDDSAISDSLKELYEREKANFRTLFEFSSDSKTYKTFTDEQAFAASYPFVHYQYDLFQEAINGLSTHNAFTGKHASVGERSMLGVFQEVIKKIADAEFGQLATFDLTYEGIRSVLKPQHQQSILIAERNLPDLAVRVLKALFLVKYVKGFKGTARNVSILMVDSFDVDLTQHQKTVQEALNRLEQEVYIQRTGDVYEFLTDDEKDVENEIKAMEVDDSAFLSLAADILYDEILKETKIRHEDNQQDYTFTRKLDGVMFKGREQELAINIITPMNEFYGDEATLISHAMSHPELLLLLPEDKRLLSDLNTFVKTDKYIRQNRNSSTADSRLRILAEKGQQNINRKTDIKQRLEKMLSEAKAIVNGSQVPGLGAEPRGRVITAFQQLVRYAYPNLKMLKTVFKEESVRNILSEQGDDLFRHDEGTLSEGESEILTHIRRKQGAGERPTVSSLLTHFSVRPYGWYQAAVLANVAKLFMRGKVELRSDSNILEKSEALSHLTNNRQFSNTIVFLQEEFDSASIQKLKRFHQEFFDESNTATEAKEVGHRFLEALHVEITKLEQISQRTQNFPFVAQLEKPLGLLKEWADKSYTVFLKDLDQIEDDWLDAKEDVIDPIKKFMGGQQKDVYLEIETFYREHRENLTDIVPDEAAHLQDFLKSDKPYRGTALQEAKALKETMTKQVEASLKEERTAAVSKVRSLAANIETLDGFSELDEAEKARLSRVSDTVLEEIQSANLLAVVRDKLSRYSIDGYQRQIGILNEINAEKAKSGGVEEPTSRYIPSSALTIDYGKGAIETEEDLDAYLNAIRQAYLAELKEKRKITL